MQKKMGPLQLSGLLVGAVLGSGVILLPPLAEAQLGQWAVVAWGMIMLLGAAFATLFAKLARVYPGSEGAPIAIREAFGPKAATLASTYLLCAVCVGPMAVLMTAADTITEAMQLSHDLDPTISGGLLILCTLLLTRKVTFVGTIALVASIAIGIVLVSGSVVTISASPMLPVPSTPLDIQAMGRALLVLFWAIVGWEIIGNYTMDVHTPERTIPTATCLGVVGISVIYLLVAWAMRSLPSTGSHTVTGVVEPLLGPLSETVVMLITTTLCICTYLMIVGGVSRLAATLAEKGHFPSLLAKRNANGAPVISLFTLVGIQSVSLFLLHFKVCTLDDLVACANVFFLANSLLAVSAAVRLIPSLILRTAGLLLIAGFIGLLAFASLWILAGAAVITLMVLMDGKACLSKVRKAVSA